MFVVVFWFVRKEWGGDMLHSTKPFLWLAFLGGIPALCAGIFGSTLLRRGYLEEGELRKLRRKEALWKQIQIQGKVNLRPWMSALRLSRAELVLLVLDEIEQGGNPGYIDWTTGMFYARDAERVGSNQCPHCGGVRESVGIGSVLCPHCQVELLIPSGARQTKASPLPPPAKG